MRPLSYGGYYEDLRSPDDTSIHPVPYQSELRPPSCVKYSCVFGARLAFQSCCQRYLANEPLQYRLIVECFKFAVVTSICLHISSNQQKRAMSFGDTALGKLQEYAQRIKNTEYDTPSTSVKSAYEVRLEVAFKELSHQVKVETKVLEEVKVDHTQTEACLTDLYFQLQAKSGDPGIGRPSADTTTRLKQLRVIKAAYDSLTALQPDLPSPESPLPALLALRNAQKQVIELKDSVSTTYQKIEGARKRLAQEQADLRDARLITNALESRITRLALEVQEKSQKTPEEAAHSMILEESTKKESFEKETKKLIKSLVKFINEKLAAMLAAEELGGPVVGDLLEVSDEMLAAGFNRRGKTKKPKSPKPDHDAKRQSRIDQIWGQNGNATSTMTNERQAAAAEMRLLTEDLLNVAAEEGTGAYVTLARDSAASRFLIRAKVAQFHPKDARKLRLIDFGRELDD